MASKFRDTKAADPFAPTRLYGDCEAGECGASARTTCPECSGHFCHGHAEHSQHSA